MKIGKVPENVLKRSVFKQIKLKRDEVLIHPGVGEDCSVLKLAPDEVFVLSTDPITGAASEIGTLAVHVTANDLASGRNRWVCFCPYFCRWMRRRLI